jgi:hypothetical protein
MLALVSVIAVLWFFHNRDKRIYEYVRREYEIRALREDYGNRDLYEFLDDPGIRGAADSGIERFRGRRDEILQRYGGAGDG